jgi:hypothetical protein
MDHVDAYPLQWPQGRPRTRTRAESALGKFPYHRAAGDVRTEIERLGGKNIVISTNLQLRQDGLPYANQRMPNDPGVAVYFTYKGKQTCFACDRWNRIEHNLRAIFKTIEALRGICALGNWRHDGRRLQRLHGSAGTDSVGRGSPVVRSSGGFSG